MRRVWGVVAVILIFSAVFASFRIIDTQSTNADQQLCSYLTESAELSLRIAVSIDDQPLEMLARKFMLDVRRNCD